MQNVIPHTESKWLLSAPPKAGAEKKGATLWCVHGCEEDAEISTAF